VVEGAGNVYCREGEFVGEGGKLAGGVSHVTCFSFDGELLVVSGSGGFWKR
jgi:hypothetical protein